jgi:hypothetical protein
MAGEAGAGNNFLGTVDTDSSLQFPSEHEGERTFLVVIAGEQLEGNGTEFIWTLYIVLGFHGIREEFSLQVDSGFGLCISRHLTNKGFCS